MSSGNINWAFGDGGDVEDLCELAERYGYSLHDDNKWRETEDETGLSDHEMWQYIWDRRDSEAENLASGE